MDLNKEYEQANLMYQHLYIRHRKGCKHSSHDNGNSLGSGEKRLDGFERK